MTGKGPQAILDDADNPIQKIATFLIRHEPFTGLDEAAIGRIAQRTKIEFFDAGDVIFEQDQTPAERVRIVVTGGVELLDRGRTLDLLGEGELFGHPSMLAGLPTGFTARAQEKTLCYRIPTDLLIPLLARPEGLRYVARSLLSRQRRSEPSQDGHAIDPARRPVAAFIRERMVTCEPTATVREVAQRMAGEGASCALVRLAAGQFGIVTDQDLRVRVVAGDVPLEAPVDRAMTAPAYAVTASQLASDVMVEMINRGIRHVPVVSARHEVLGVVTDLDLLASDTRTPFMVRRNIARASNVEGLIAAAEGLRPSLIALHDAQVAPIQLCGIIAGFASALTRRALELLTQDESDLPALAWFATGSVGRQEAFPSSDIDTVLAWEGADDGDRLRTLASDVLGILDRCGFARDENAASAAAPLFARSAEAWRRAIERWFDRPEDARLLIVISILADTHPVYATDLVSDAFVGLRSGRHPRFMEQMRRLALAHRPPTGFMRNIVVEHSGEHRGLLDIKQGGLLPIVDLARYLALATGSGATSTIDRLGAAADAGALSGEEATTLKEAFNLFLDLRMDHQIQQLRLNRRPNDFIDPAELNSLLRRYLREAFRSIARSQRRLPPNPVV